MSYSTVTALAVPPVRFTMMVACGPASPTLYAAAPRVSVPATSLSTMFRIAVEGESRAAPPTGLLRFSRTVWAP